MEMLVDANHLTGSLPPELWKLKDLRCLRLNSTQFTGSLLADLGKLGSLVEMHLDSIQLIGPLPPELGKLNSVRWLDWEPPSPGFGHHSAAAQPWLWAPLLLLVASCRMRCALNVACLECGVQLLAAGSVPGGGLRREHCSRSCLWVCPATASGTTAAAAKVLDLGTTAAAAERGCRAPLLLLFFACLVRCVLIAACLELQVLLFAVGLVHRVGLVGCRAAGLLLEVCRALGTTAAAALPWLWGHQCCCLLPLGSLRGARRRLSCDSCGASQVVAGHSFCALGVLASAATDAARGRMSCARCAQYRMG